MSSGETPGYADCFAGRTIVTPFLPLVLPAVAATARPPRPTYLLPRDADVVRDIALRSRQTESMICTYGTDRAAPRSTGRHTHKHISRDSICSTRHLRHQIPTLSRALLNILAAPLGYVLVYHAEESHHARHR